MAQGQSEIPILRSWLGQSGKQSCFFSVTGKALLGSAISLSHSKPLQLTPLNLTVVKFTLGTDMQLLGDHSSLEDLLCSSP